MYKVLKVSVAFVVRSSVDLSDAAMVRQNVNGGTVAAVTVDFLVIAQLSEYDCPVIGTSEY